MGTYSTVSFADICEINISAASQVFLDESWHHKSSCSPFSRLYYVKAGEGFLKHNGNEKECLKPGNKIYIFR